jgi:hypothetical protein
MRVKFQHSSLALLAVGMLFAQDKAEKPVKFSGEVKAGQEFRKPIGHGLIFLLKADDEDGWVIEVQPEGARGEPCRNYSTVIAQPLNGYTPNDLNASYGVTAEQAVKRTPREVAFVLDGASCRLEFERMNRLSWPKSYPAEEVEASRRGYGTSAGGHATLKIVQSKVSGPGEDGKIEWIKFDVEVTFAGKG